LTSFAEEDKSSSLTEVMENKMLAVIETGGKQYHVKTGDVIKVEKLKVNKGETVILSKVLSIYDVKKGTDIIVGAPYIKSAKVKAEALEQIRDDKIVVFKKKRRQNYRRKKGHRQNITVLKITGIEEK
jgi:large subunit ribosomal protein L21